MLTHPIQRRYLAEDLIRLRRADEQRRYAASQRQGRIDPNPHQVDAVIFALQRIREGGCILADEVGLGKTIEAGLVMAQLRAEGAQRILVILPKPLVGQWQLELYKLFAIEATASAESAADFAGPGVFLVGREFAGGTRGSVSLGASEPFDLVVIDEAHEIFAGIYRRYDREGLYQEESDQAITAHRVRQVLGETPVLLLTATPIQNSLTELWGLVQYVEPTGTLLGDLRTFRDVFCDGDDRTLARGQAHELRDRLDQVLQRTLRRQAQEFLERPFVKRFCRRLDYGMTPDEKALYDDVTTWLLEPDLIAFSGRHRRLLLIGFHRRMASSLSALAASLERVAKRLRGMLAGEAPKADDDALGFARDLEDDDLLDEVHAAAAAAERGTTDEVRPRAPNALRAELARVESFVARARALPGDSKAGPLLDALRMVADRAERGGSGKAVIFTESLSTQDYLVGLLVRNGFDRADLTVFRGQNDSEEARDALARWRLEEGAKLPAYRQPRRSVAVRLALVHEFATRSRVFISTEAGAKGLNLQFADTVINYDLPWNPQRIEQRIGRCHRYTQERDVTVFNFVNRDNEAERLAFDILSRKLDLFGTVLDASDNVLYETRGGTPETLAGALGGELERQRARLYERARDPEELARGMAELNETLERERRRVDDRLAETARLIQTRFDEDVQSRFRRIGTELREGLAWLDKDLTRLVAGYLSAIDVAHVREEGDDAVLFEVSASDRLPAILAEGGRFVVGDRKGHDDADPVHLAHPLVRAAVEEARASAAERAFVRVRLEGGVLATLRAAAGRRGRLVVSRVDFNGFEPTQRLMATAVLEGAQAPLDEQAAQALIHLPFDAVDPFELDLDEAVVDAAVEEMLFIERFQAEAHEQERFETAMSQIERFVDDRALVLRRRVKALDARIDAATHRRDSALGADRRAGADHALGQLQTERDKLSAQLEQLEARDDDVYQTRRRLLEDRRYAAPAVTRVIDVVFIVGGGSANRSDAE